MQKKFNKLSKRAVVYIKKRRWKLIFLLIFFVILDYLSRLPYIGILLDTQNKFISFWIVSLWTLKLKAKFNFLAGIVIMLLALFYTMRGRIIAAESMGVVAFVLLGVGVLQYFWEYLKEERKSSKT